MNEEAAGENSHAQEQINELSVPDQDKQPPLLLQTTDLPS